MIIQKQITQQYNHSFKISKAGLVAISTSARCRARKQLSNNKDEDLRVELEKHYPNLDPHRIDSIFIDYNAVRVTRLKDPFTNIRYVAAKIHFSKNRWEKAGFDLENNPEILGTLYNIENIEKPIEPHANPETNEFGKGVKRNYNKVKKLLGL